MTILITDDVAMMRSILIDMLVRYCGIKPEDIYEASNGAEAVERYMAVRPNLVLIDISMPVMNGIEAVRNIMKLDENAIIIMIATSNDEENIRTCIEAGAIDYIGKPPSPERVIKAVKAAAVKMKESLPYEPEGTNRLFAHEPADESVADRVASLEKQVDALKSELALLWKVIGIPV